jgi:hypothetical protein
MACFWHGRDARLPARDKARESGVETRDWLQLCHLVGTVTAGMGLRADAGALLVPLFLSARLALFCLVPCRLVSSRLALH